MFLELNVTIINCKFYRNMYFVIAVRSRHFLVLLLQKLLGYRTTKMKVYRHSRTTELTVYTAL